MVTAAFPYRLYLVIAAEACAGRDLLAVAEAAVRGGVDLVQLREKQVDEPTFLARAERLAERLSCYSVPLLINDNLRVARRVGAAGLHVGNHDLPPTQVRAQWPGVGLLGYSLEYTAQLHTPEAEAADYLGISPVFRTPTKTDTVTEWGLAGVRAIRAATPKPLVAIGNIHAGNAGPVLQAGADCLAVVSAICQAPDPERAAAVLRNQIDLYC
ncbi:thiamine phosphate synthase [Hymenobacter sp. NST-14]|uniref:thiamine phosphate synthase n=1 Tax=Hymenobacter piscis TaxID=2839984 RepID=UPI001C02D884|nr:thiamine phosphate synthase [Hymenobacter piscis]MBT9394844.1 thiamine phosphate synthase [Hymenobacter piscis]